MALIRPIPRSGSLSETTLWTNSAPTSTFGAQNITLSEDIDNFDYIKLEFNASTSDSTNTCECIMSVSEFKKYANNNSAIHYRALSPLARSSGTAYTRAFYYVSDTSIGFINAEVCNATGNTNSAIIPTYVKGLKL